MQIRDLIPWAGRGLQPRREEEESPVLALQRDINRIFDDFWRRFEAPFERNASAMFGVAEPVTDVSETDTDIEVSVELPGLDDKDVEVSIAGDLLMIRGEKKAEHEEKKRGYYISERAYGRFQRAIPLPPGAEPEKAKAEFKKGVLRIRMPKSAETAVRPQRIEITSA